MNVLFKYVHYYFICYKKKHVQAGQHKWLIYNTVTGEMKVKMAYRNVYKGKLVVEFT